VNQVHETVNWVALRSTVDPRIECGTSSPGSSPDGATWHQSSPQLQKNEKERMGHLTKGNTGQKGAKGGMAAMDRRGSGLELSCRMSRARRGIAWVQNGTSGGSGSSWAFYIGWGGKMRGRGGTAAAGGGFSLPTGLKLKREGRGDTWASIYDGKGSVTGDASAQLKLSAEGRPSVTGGAMAHRTGGGGGSGA
jgi:hypothetical protein